jgi:hypothetical protein
MAILPRQDGLLADSWPGVVRLNNAPPCWPVAGYVHSDVHGVQEGPSKPPCALTNKRWVGWAAARMGWVAGGAQARRVAQRPVPTGVGPAWVWAQLVQQLQQVLLCSSPSVLQVDSGGKQQHSPAHTAASIMACAFHGLLA